MAKCPQFHLHVAPVAAARETARSTGETARFVYTHSAGKYAKGGKWRG
jgi:hypothetical protein